MNVHGFFKKNATRAELSRWETRDQDSVLLQLVAREGCCVKQFPRMRRLPSECVTYLVLQLYTLLHSHHSSPCASECEFAAAPLGKHSLGSLHKEPPSQPGAVLYSTIVLVPLSIRGVSTWVKRGFCTKQELGPGSMSMPTYVWHTAHQFRSFGRCGRTTDIRSEV